MRKIILSAALLATGLLIVACAANSDTMRASSTPEVTPTGPTGAREAADKTEDAGDAVKKGAKKAGRKIKDAVKPD